MEVFPAHLDRKFVKIIKIITVFGFPILGPILGPIVGPIVTGDVAALILVAPRYMWPPRVFRGPYKAQ